MTSIPRGAKPQAGWPEIGPGYRLAPSFDAVIDAALYADAHTPEARSWSAPLGCANDWIGGVTFKKTCAEYAHPPDRWLEEARSVRETFRPPAHVGGVDLVRTVVGAIPCVPAVLAGAPDAMLRPVYDEGAAVPMTVWVSASHGAIRTAQEIRDAARRLNAWVLQTVLRGPVTVMLYTVKHTIPNGWNFALRLDPMDSARFCWMLAAPQAMRHVVYRAEAPCSLLKSQSFDRNKVPPGLTPNDVIVRDIVTFEPPS